MSHSLKRSLFKAAFGSRWQHLPPVFKKHYHHTPFQSHNTQAHGKLDIRCCKLFCLLKPIYQWLNFPPMLNANNINVKVHYLSHQNSNCFSLHRTFLFPDKTPYCFSSKMYSNGKNEVIDLMRFGLGWRINYLWKDDQVILQHKGYAVKLFNQFIPLPLTLLLGRIDAYEYAIDDSHFFMKTKITHFLFNTLYSYEGKFKVLP